VESSRAPFERSAWTPAMADAKNCRRSKLKDHLALAAFCETHAVRRIFSGVVSFPRILDINALRRLGVSRSMRVILSLAAKSGHSDTPVSHGAALP
jgi:hypothetical protein